MADLTGWLAALGGAAKAGVATMGFFRKRAAERPMPAVTIRAATNVRGDTAIFYAAENRSDVELILRGIRAVTPKVPLRYGYPDTGVDMDAYYAGMVEAGVKTTGNETLPEPFIPRGEGICGFVVAAGQHGDVDLEFTFQRADNGRHLRQRALTVNVRKIMRAGELTWP